MEAIPIPDAEAKTVADKFVERIVSIFGVSLLFTLTKGQIMNQKYLKKCV
jgi:hypothetical protein